MKKILLCLAALALCGGFAAEAAESGASLLRVKTKEWKDTEIFSRDGRLYAAPAALEKGGRWTVSEEGGAALVTTETGAVVRIPIGADGLCDFTFFAPQAGISYELNEKKNEIRFKDAAKEKAKAEKEKAKAEKKKKKEKKTTVEAPRPVYFLWDPDSSFAPGDAFFGAEAGERVLSPDWGTAYALAAGGLYFGTEYVAAAGAADFRVMPLISNDFDLDATSAFLADDEKMRAAADTLAAYAEVYGLDGWNLDFENMKPAEKSRFTAFAAELAARLHARGKKLSADITAIGSDPASTWNACYDRAALAEVLDYEILMGYDQTPRGARAAGPTSAYDWLDRVLPPLLEEIPAEKLILGLPLYTRVWTGADGAGLSSDVLTVRYTEDFLRRHKAVPRWQEKERQFYADWREQGVRKRVWLEEARSLSEKLSLVEKYHLAGAAFWRNGFEDETVYGTLELARVWEISN